MSGVDPDDRPDDLTERYRAATADDADRPGDAVRQSILAHARSAAEARARTTPLARGAVSMNRARPLRISVAASVIVAGLATLLAWHTRPPTPPAAELAEPAPNRARVQHLIPSPATTPPATTPPAATPPAATPPAATPPATTPPAATPAATFPPARASPAPNEATADVAAERGGARAAPLPARVPSNAAARRSASSPTLVSAAESGDLERVEQLLRGGASTEQTDARGRTALLIATSRGDVSMVRLLLAAGAQSDVVDADGDTPLAAARRQRSPELVHLLEGHR